MYIFNFFKYLNILLEQQQQSLNFLTCNYNNWQVFISKFGQSFSIQNLLVFDWWKFIFSNLQTFEFLFIFLDVLIYFTFFIILIQFGLLYSNKSSYVLLTKSGEHSRRFISTFWMILSLLLILSFIFNINYFNNFSTFHNLYYINYYTQFSKFFILLIWLGLYKFLDTLSTYNQGIAEFPLLSFLILCFSISLVSAGNLALLFICLEGFSLILYIMTTIGRSQGGITSAVKYFSFGTAGSILIIWGIVNLYSILTTLSFKSIFYSIEFLLNTNELQNNLIFTKLSWSCSLIIIGFLIKLGSAPLHQWVVDVYSGVPLFITSFFAIFVKFVIYIVFLRLIYLFNSSLEIEYAAILSLIIGCFGTLRQFEIKRFLAYGSITHVGFLLSGDLLSSCVYLAAYLLTSFLFFSVLLNNKLNNKELIYITDFKHMSLSHTFLEKSILVISLASMAGLPPFAGFYGKMLVWSSLMEDVYLYNDFLSYFLLTLNLIVSLIIIFYYMRIINFIFLGSETSKLFILSNYLYNTNITYYKKSYLFGANSSYNILSYIKSRIINIKVIQYICLFLISFWTLVMPYISTLFLLFIENLINF